MCNDKFDVFKPLPRDLVIWINLKGLAVAVRRIVVPLIRKEVSTKIKPSLINTPFSAVGGLCSELLGTMNIPPAESNCSCIDQVGRVGGVQTVRFHKQALCVREVAFCFQEVTSLCQNQ